MSLTVDRLPKKLVPYLLNTRRANPAHAEIRAAVEAAAGRGLAPIKAPSIFESGNWIFKRAREDGSLTTADTHLYRVRKADKIRAYIQKNHLETALIVPRKYLFEYNGELLVASEKLTLSNEVASVYNLSYETAVKEFGSSANFRGEQIHNLYLGNPKHSISPVQAKALAELSFLGYTDHSYNNIFFTPSGQVAILDTEPVKRALTKSKFPSLFAKIFKNKSSLRVQQGLTGTAKVKTYCDTLEARRAVERVENRHVLWDLATLITKLALTTIILSSLAVAIPMIGLPAILGRIAHLVLTFSCYLKIVNYSISFFGDFIMWRHSREFATTGLNHIINLESRGII